MPVTHQAIAEKLGISRAAVTLALHRTHRARINPETRKEILRVARQMGYEPRNITTHTIALVVHSDGLWSDATTSVLMAANELLRAGGYRMSITTLDADSIGEAKNLFHQKAVDGVIFTEWYGKASHCLLSLPVPWVLLADADDVDEGVDQIAADTVETARRLTEYLISKGHERIFIAAGCSDIGFHQRFERGVRDAFENARLPASDAVTDAVAIDKTAGPPRDVEDLLLPLLKGRRPVTAVIAVSPGGALAILNRLQYRGFRVPQDVSIVSLLDSPRLRAFRPAMTTTTMLSPQTVELAARRLIQKITEPETIPARILVPGEVVERDSVVSVEA